MNVLARVSDIQPEQLESLLLNCSTKPSAVRSLGHQAFLEGNTAFVDVTQQVCFDKALDLKIPPTERAAYAEVHTFLNRLLSEEVIIHN